MHHNSSTSSSPSAFTRRQFLYTGLTLASAAVTVPWFLNSSVMALPHAAPGMSSIPGAPEDQILVVIQLSGGNDGLNTVVPFGMDPYYRARPGIAISRDQVLRLGRTGDLGLHPQMTAIRELYDEGLCSILQGVGYPNPSRSHFKSMDIWHTADTSASGNGWLGRYFDSQCCGYGKGESGRSPAGNDAATERSGRAAQPGVAIGRRAPLAMHGQHIKPVSFENADLFRWIGEDVDDGLSAHYRQLAARQEDGGHDHDSNATFLMRTSLDAQVSSDLIRRAVDERPLVQYPANNPLARQLSMVGSMIRAGLPTRVYYVTLGGFDTHAGQGGALGAHANLLNRFSTAVRAFYEDLKAQGNDTRVLTMSFSEFGRRVGQNASQGTDHGTAAPMFLFGPMVRPGLIGNHPSLSDLEDGDMKFGLDFRSVYAGILREWLGADPRKILRGSFRPVPVVRKG